MKAGWAEVHNPIDPKEIEEGEVIGKGGAGVVKAGEWRGEKVAVKKIPVVQKEEFLAEVVLMSVLDHPHIVSCTGASLKDEIVIISPLFGRGSVDQLIERGVELPTKRILSFLVDTCLGMGYLHLFKIIHRDLKPANLLVSDDWRVAVTDFGISRVTSKRMTKAMGTTFYIAPEMFTSDEYTNKVDVYSFSYILWGLWMKRPPYQHLTTFQLVPEIVEKGLRPPVPEDCLYSELMEKCWDGNPAVRPSFSKLSYEFKKLLGEEGGGGSSGGNSSNEGSSSSLISLGCPSPSFSSSSTLASSSSSPFCPSPPLFPSPRPEESISGSELDLGEKSLDKEEKEEKEEEKEGGEESWKKKEGV